MSRFIQKLSRLCVEQHRKQMRNQGRATANLANLDSSCRHHISKRSGGELWFGSRATLAVRQSHRTTRSIGKTGFWDTTWKPRVPARYDAPCSFWIDGTIAASANWAPFISAASNVKTSTCENLRREDGKHPLKRQTPPAPWLRSGQLAVTTTDHDRQSQSNQRFFS